MSLAVLFSRAQVGIESPQVVVEVHLSGGLPSLSIVGLPETAVKESKERVRSALLTAGFEFPQRRITINLAPADLPKEGGRYDLAIAIGILQASGQLKCKSLDQYEMIAELSLSGEVRAIRGALPASVACGKAKRSLILPEACAQEARLIGETCVLPATHLLQVFAHLQGKQAIEPYVPLPANPSLTTAPDMAEVKGQLQARRALEVAAAGEHNILFTGPPGSGKSLLASCLPGILPELTIDERLEVAAIHSIAGHSVDAACAGIRPFRNPHHTASAVALVGGGSHPRPGEISLANKGILFLDELPEFPRRVLDVLREPIETGSIMISRATRQVCFPASFQLVAAMNPCTCGYAKDGTDRCTCSPDQVRRYQGRVSGPLLDRIDIQLWVSALSPDTLLNRQYPAESSADVRRRVVAAREKQLSRQGFSNRHLNGRLLDQHCSLTDDGQGLLTAAMKNFSLSARGCHRVLRVARTLADLAGDEQVQTMHLLEALAFRGQLQPIAD